MKPRQFIRCRYYLAFTEHATKCAHTMQSLVKLDLDHGQESGCQRFLARKSESADVGYFTSNTKRHEICLFIFIDSRRSETDSTLKNCYVDLFTLRNPQDNYYTNLIPTPISFLKFDARRNGFAFNFFQFVNRKKTRASSCARKKKGVTTTN